MSLFAFSQVVFAASKELITLNWSADVLPMDDNNPFLEYPGIKEKISQAINEKLHSLQREGKLPFNLKEVSTDYGNHVIVGDDPIGIIPLSTLDKSFDSSYHANGKTFYRSIIFSGLTLALISADPENDSWRILGTIPLNGYDMIGDNLNDLREQPITLQEKANKFAEITIKMINDHLDFSKDKKVARDVDIKSQIPDTYQVTEVKITSNKAKEIFAGREDEVKEIIGAFFTNSYQRKTKRIVYPPRGSGKWKRDVNKNLYTFQMNTPSGEINFTMEMPKNPITLELSGVAIKEMDSNSNSKVIRDIFYKVWLKKQPIENKELAEYTDHTTRREIKTGNAWVEYDPADVLIELVIDAAQNMGAQKK
ncbi:MAG: hypothetical protein IJ728_05450 [Selenomonadaceae bacterium]|nr:hypothetical protein [Selenomonadaceae bacterium]